MDESRVMTNSAESEKLGKIVDFFSTQWVILTHEWVNEEPECVSDFTEELNDQVNEPDVC